MIDILDLLNFILDTLIHSLHAVKSIHAAFKLSCKRFRLNNELRENSVQLLNLSIGLLRQFFLDLDQVNLLQLLLNVLRHEQLCNSLELGVKTFNQALELV
jgi:hypothetical protein